MDIQKTKAWVLGIGCCVALVGCDDWQLRAAGSLARAQGDSQDAATLIVKSYLTGKHYMTPAPGVALPAGVMMPAPEAGPSGGSFNPGETSMGELELRFTPLDGGVAGGGE